MRSAGRAGAYVSPRRLHASRGHAPPHVAPPMDASRDAGAGGTSRGAGRQGDKLTSRLDAVRALQDLARKRLGLPADRNNGRDEPCAWVALDGECLKRGCYSCAGKLTMPEDLVRTVKARCHDKALRVKQPKKPG